jgi:hypothetical protein
VFGRIAALLMHESRQRVRELRYTIPHDGFRTKRVTLVTARLEPRKYSARELAELYGARRTASASSAFSPDVFILLEPASDHDVNVAAASSARPIG